MGFTSTRCELLHTRREREEQEIVCDLVGENAANRVTRTNDAQKHSDDQFAGEALMLSSAH